MTKGANAESPGIGALNMIVFVLMIALTLVMGGRGVECVNLFKRISFTAKIRN